MGHLSDLDRHLFDRVAAARLRGAHPVLPRLTRTADHGLLWFGTAAVLGLAGRRVTRRAALRGVGSLAIASLTTNTVAKWTTRRARPVLDGVPLVRRLARQPLTTSFPSGHSASAAAFATAVALEAPRYGAAVAPVAAAVAASRVYVGVHYPGDVLAGVALGMGAAALTCRWWPLRPQAPAAARPRTKAPALPGGAGLVVVVNDGAGPGTVSGARADAAERLRDLLPGAEIVVCAPGDDLSDLLERACDRAAGLGGALGVCGGDGSVNAAAALAARRRVPLAVFPGGTLNHFAQELGVETLEETAGAVRGGSAVAVDLGRARPLPSRSRAGSAPAGPAEGRADHPPRHDARGNETGQEPAGEVRFLNTFSVGVYPELVRAREALEKRVGKWPAVAVGLVRVLRRARPLDIRINGSPRRVWLLFAGNGQYHPEGFAPTYRLRLDDGLLDVRLVDGGRPLARTRLIAAVLSGTLGRSRVYTAGCVRRLRLSGLRGVRSLAFDGEIAPAPDALVLDKDPGALTVYRPAEPEERTVRRARRALRLAAAARTLGRRAARPLRNPG